MQRKQIQLVMWIAIAITLGVRSSRADEIDPSTVTKIVCTGQGMTETIDMPNQLWTEQGPGLQAPIMFTVVSGELRAGDPVISLRGNYSVEYSRQFKPFVLYSSTSTITLNTSGANYKTGVFKADVEHTLITSARTTLGTFKKMDCHFETKPDCAAGPCD